MYEVICARMDALSAVFGLLRKDGLVREGVNPWCYAGGSSSPVMAVEKEKCNDWVVRVSEETLVDGKKSGGL